MGIILDGINLEKKIKIVRLCKAIIPEARIYLYGSRARGKFSETSDIDLALEASKPISYYDIAELKDILEASNIGYAFDIVDINSIIDSKFKAAITKEMILWTE